MTAQIETAGDVTRGMSARAGERFRRTEEILPDLLAELDQAATRAATRLDRLERHRAAVLAELRKPRPNGVMAATAEALLAQTEAVREEAARLRRAAESTRAFLARGRPAA